MALHKMENPQINLKTSLETKKSGGEQKTAREKQTQTPSMSAEKLNFTKEGLVFPDSFLWGTSLSAYQTEGGIKNNWSEWENSPKRINKFIFRIRSNA